MKANDGPRGDGLGSRGAWITGAVALLLATACTAVLDVHPVTGCYPDSTVLCTGDYGYTCTGPGVPDDGDCYQMYPGAYCCSGDAGEDASPYSDAEVAIEASTSIDDTGCGMIVIPASGLTPACQACGVSMCTAAIAVCDSDCTCVTTVNPVISCLAALSPGSSTAACLAPILSSDGGFETDGGATGDAIEGVLACARMCQCL